MRLLGVVLALALAGSTAHGAVLRVPSEYPTIGAAIDAANQADTVLVAPGVYPETLGIEKFITIRSEVGPQATSIDGCGAVAAVIDIFSGLIGHGDGWVIEGFSVFNGHFGVAVTSGITQAVAVVRDCIVSDCTGAGILAGPERVVIEGCVIADNGASGIWLSDGTLAGPSKVNGNLIIGNGGAGVLASGDYCGFEIRHNTIHGNDDGVVVYRPFALNLGVISSNAVTCNTRRGVMLTQLTPYDCSEIRYNDVWGNGDDVGPGSECEQEILGYNGNISDDPLFCAPSLGDFTVGEDSPCLAAGEGGSDIGAFGAGCGPGTTVPESEQTSSWGRVKALHR